MAVYVQVLLSLFCMLLAQGHIIHRKSHHFSPSQPPVHDGVDGHALYSPLNSDLSLRPALADRPIDGDVFSYNSQRSFDDYYGDGNYNPGLYSYFPYPPYDNTPFGYPPINNGYNRPSQNPGNPNAPNGPNEYQNPNGNPSNNDHPADGNNGDRNHKPEDKQQPANHDESKPSVLGKQSEDVPPKANKMSNDDEPGNKNSLKQNKDYLLVGNSGNNLYLLHEANTPNTNAIVVPNTNQPVGNNVVYVPYNPQQPGNQVYQIVSRQQPTSTNIPTTANRVNTNGYNNVVANPVSNNVPTTNPSYVLIYANGQLIQVPGVVLNTPQNVAPINNGSPGTNIDFPNTVAPPNVVYQPGNNPMYIQLPNGSPVSNGVTNPHYTIQYPQLVGNPNNIPNNNVGTYAVVNQPNTQQPPIAPNNMGNGYAQPNAISNPGNQGSVANFVNHNPATSVNNQPIQPAYALPMNNNNNNQVTNPPNQEKEDNAVSPAGNNVPPTTGQPINPQPVGQPTEPSNNAVTNTLDVLPAVMVSGFKENQGKDKKKEQENAKDVNKKEKKMEST